MAYVSGCEHDVFISYAHVDNVPLSVCDQGWISLLVQDIKKLLDQKLGRPDCCDLWMDYRLRNHEPFTPNIMDAVGRSATLLVILSPGYLASPWCGRELKAFRDMVHGRDRSGIFVVELDPLRDKRPAEFNELKGYRFYAQGPEDRYPHVIGFPKPDAHEGEYYFRAVTNLCHELADKLRKLREASEESGAPGGSGVPWPPPAASEKTVYLVEPTDDLLTEHTGVKDYLSQMNVHVVPSTFYPQDAEGFERAARKDLERCDLFVQLLSHLPGRIPEGMPQGYQKLQFDLARQAGKKILQWRSPTLDLATVENATAHDLLCGSLVEAEPIMNFEAKIRDTLRDRGAEIESPPRMKKLIFVNRDPDDEAFAETIRRKLKKLRANVVWPLEHGDISVRREFLHEALKTCDGVVLIHGNSPGSWVSHQLLQCHKALAKREDNWKGLALCRFPPRPKEELNMSLEELHIFDCDQSLSRRKLNAFLKDLAAAVHA